MSPKRSTEAARKAGNSSAAAAGAAAAAKERPNKLANWRASLQSDGQHPPAPRKEAGRLLPPVEGGHRPQSVRLGLVSSRSVLLLVLGALNCQKRDLHLKNHKSHETSAAAQQSSDCDQITIDGC